MELLLLLFLGLIGIVCIFLAFAKHSKLFLLSSAFFLFVFSAILWSEGYDSSTICDATGCHTYTTLTYNDSNQVSAINENFAKINASNNKLVWAISLLGIVIAIVFVLMAFLL